MKNNIVSREYSIAATEILDVLEHLPKRIVGKIPTKFMEFLKSVSDSDYEVKIDYSKGLDKIELQDKSKALLAMIYRNYLCTEQERKEFDEILLENERKYQEELRRKYNPDNIFKKEEEKIEVLEGNTQLIEYKESKWYHKILDKIKKFFKKK